MKNIAVILSILFLVLSIKPCTDGNNVEDLHKDEISVNHNHQEDSDDSCPITCICNCCGMAITYVPIKTFNLNRSEEISTEVFSSYQSNYRFDFLSTIWQPPQLMS
ncbi:MULTISPECIES: DUF6660 family protein [Flavobacteriaceae]|uniref:DUF6660 family protein n=1 Tax=Flavobacteriaceae TaxID=49546 RepID=UPI0011EC3A66|nr:DUF6660 family protein [Pareuzebyella sediminis]